MKSFEESGCDECRRGVLTGQWPPPTEIAVSDGPIFLHRCGKCGVYWETNLRKSHAIDEVEARRKFPKTFLGRTNTEMTREIPLADLERRSRETLPIALLCALTVMVLCGCATTGGPRQGAPSSTDTTVSGYISVGAVKKF
jgi:hypothetical protein